MEIRISRLGDSLSWVWLATSCALGACGKSDASAAPHAKVIAFDGGQADMYASDPCVFDARFSCHSYIGEYLSYENWGTQPYGDPTFECPDGCSTYPLGYSTKYAVQTAINSHIKSTPECAWVAPFLQTALNEKRIRHYGLTDGNYGDNHRIPGDTLPQNVDIHVYDQTFGDAHDLAMTLIHEAAH